MANVSFLLLCCHNCARKWREKGGEESVFGAEGVGGVAELLAAAVLAFVTTCEGFECLGLGGSFFAFYLFSVLEFFEHGQFALGKEMLVEERLEGG